MLGIGIVVGLSGVAIMYIGVVHWVNVGKTWLEGGAVLGAGLSLMVIGVVQGVQYALESGRDTDRELLHGALKLLGWGLLFLLLYLVLAYVFDVGV